MKARVAASVVLAVGIAFGTAGCDLIAPQATETHYDASDGVNGQTGDVKIRNAFLVAGDGNAVNLVATFVTSGSGLETIKIEPNGDPTLTQSFELSAGTTVVGNETRIQINGLTIAPGGLFPVYFVAGTGEGVRLQLPVLDGSLEPYSSYTPTPVPTQPLLG